MEPVEVRKYVTVVEEIFHEGGPRADQPLKMAAIAAEIGRASCRERV